MNFLGHLYFSKNDLDLMYANLFGDFVKGINFNHYSTKIIEGIELHRKIDFYFDNHFAIIESRRSLYSDLPKVSSIAIDLFIDHLLAKTWGEHHVMELTHFLNQFYKFEPKCKNEFSDDFNEFIVQMKEKRWLNYYHVEFGLEKACQGLSRKISFENKLHLGLSIFKKNEEIISNAFSLFMEDAKKEFLTS